MRVELDSGLREEYVWHVAGTREGDGVWKGAGAWEDARAWGQLDRGVG